MSNQSKSIEEKYKTMDPISHVLHRSGMYVGSIRNESVQNFIYSADDAKMVLTTVNYSPALLKLLDEVISNSCDEFRRKDNLGLTELSVTLHKDGTCIIRDNGGIPVVIHKEANIYVPEFIFGTLRTSSNYNDDEDRNVIGTNGLGQKLTSIFSSKFSVYTADGKNSYFRSWENNMKDICDDLYIEACKNHFTEFKFKIDFSKLDCGTEFTDDFISVIEKRCIDAAAANPGLKVKFLYKDGNTARKSDWHFKKFEHYIELFSDYIDIEDFVKFNDKMKSVWVFPESNINIGFVNGAFCSKGTHIRAVRSEINAAVAEHIKAKHKIDVGARNVDGKYSMFCIFNVSNPAYSSQTKEELTTPADRFSPDPDYEFKIPTSFLKDILKSELVSTVVDWYKQKQEVEDQKTLRKLNRQAKQKVRNSDKFIDANSKKREERELWIFEGGSASAGFRYARNPRTQAAFLLRGVIRNTLSDTPSKIMANKELGDIINIIGLQWGQRNEADKLNFGKIVIATDADFDGNKISALLLVFFNLFPELYEQGLIYKSISPIIIAQKGTTTKKYYTMADFRKDEPKLNGYKIRYIKGLGGLKSEEFYEMLQMSNLHKFTKDELADNNIKLWFGKSEAHNRKATMSGEV